MNTNMDTNMEEVLNEEVLTEAVETPVEEEEVVDNTISTEELEAVRD